VSTYFLVTPLGKKKPSPTDMAGEKEDKSMIDPTNIIDVEYGDVPEDHRLALEA